MGGMDRFAAYVDLDAVRDNVATLRRRAGSAQVMAVVKADGYGHGMLPCARACVEAGADWLGVAFVEEALALRAAGLQVPVLAWLVAPGDNVAAAASADVDISISADWGLEAAAAAAAVTGRPTRVHLKVDSGLGRAGAPMADWPTLTEAAAKQVADGAIDVVGVWSHLAYADAPGHPTIGNQVTAFGEALEVAERAGLRPQVRHLANSAATLALPSTHFDLVRPGVAVYGLSPGPDVGTAAE